MLFLECKQKSSQINRDMLAYLLEVAGSSLSAARILVNQEAELVFNWNGGRHRIRLT